MNPFYMPFTASSLKQNETYREVLPLHPALRGIIRCFWGSDRPYLRNEENAMPTLVVPDTCADIIYQIDYTENSVAGYFCGVNDTSFVSQVDVKDGHLVSVFAIRFYAWEAWAFSEDSLKGTINSLYDVQSRFSWVDKVLRPQLFFKQSLKERTALAEEVFLKRLFLARQNDTISYAISQILDKKGRLGADWLSRSCFISSRQLERLFHEYIGITPKKLCNLVRYQCLWNEILRNPGFRVQDAVYKYGYTDQSHLMREFKRYHTMDIKNALAYAQGIPLSAEGNVGNIQYFPQSL